MFMTMPPKYTENAPQALIPSCFTRSGGLFHRKQGYINAPVIFTRFYTVFYLNKRKMTAYGGLPPALLRLVLVYEGGILKAYAIALIRRLSVRSYQSILSRNFRFYGLEHYCFPHLVRLLQTEVFSVQRFRGVTTKRVYRKSIIPWMPWIHTLQMRN